MTNCDMPLAPPARARRPYKRLQFSREVRWNSRLLDGLARNLSVLQKKSGLKKPEFAEHIGVSGATFRALRNRSANPKLAPLFQISNRLQIPVSALCGVSGVRGRVISREQALEHVAEVMREATVTTAPPSIKADMDRSQTLGISLFQLYRIRNCEATPPPLLVCEDMAARIGMDVWELLGVDASKPLRKFEKAGGREKRAYTRLRFPRETRLETPILDGLARTLSALQKKSGLKKPEYAHKLGISGAAFRMLRNCSANPKLAPLFEMSIRLQIPLSALCGVQEVSGRLIGTEHALRHMAAVIAERTAGIRTTDAERSKVLGISLLQFYRIRRLEASPPVLVCEEMAGRLGITLWELLGVDASTPLRTD